MSSALYCCLPFTKRGVYRQIFVLFPVTNFTKIRPVGTALIRADRQTDRPEEVNSLFPLFVTRRLITRPDGNFWVDKYRVAHEMSYH